MTKVSEKLSYDPNLIIGRGSFGTIVFSGIYSPSTAVAVKRLQIANAQDDTLKVKKEVELMMKAKDHPNILRYIVTEKDDNFLFIVTELCVAGTLKEYITGNDYTGPRFHDEREILWQITRGLAHLHELDIVHRDLKPVNILIYIPPSEENEEQKPPIIKLADFGISKVLNPDTVDYTNTSVTKPNGTRGWMAPEVYELKRPDSKVDIFALGLIFGFILSGGKHPFGDSNAPIKKRMRMKMVRNDLKEPYSSENDETFDLIKFMLAMNPQKRPTVKEVASNILFPVNTQKLFERICASFQGGNITAYGIAQLEKLLMDDSIDVNVQFISGYTPLHVLCRYYGNKNLINVVRLLIQKGANVNTKENLGQTPLSIVCEWYKEDNLKDIIQLFIEKGAEINTKDKDGWTTLDSLSRYYQNDNLIEIIQLLIDNGAEVNTNDLDGWTPLLFLCRHYQNDNLIDIVQLLLGKGAEVNTKETDGLTSLHFLCRHYQNDNLIDIIQLFIEKGAKVNTKETDGWTFLHYLCNHYQNDNLIDIIKLLIEKRAKVNTKNKDGWTPLHSLCRYYQNDNLIDIVELLLEKGSDVNATTTVDRWTPLHILCRNYKNDNLIDIVQLLIENGAEVYTKETDGWTALHLLCHNYEIDNEMKKEKLESLVRLFEKYGASMDAVDNYKKNTQ